ncbi:MAG TPA: hypothetical protein VGG35_10200 [Streptosporangiaceae bacterium]
MSDVRSAGITATSGGGCRQPGGAGQGDRAGHRPVADHVGHGQVLAGQDVEPADQVRAGFMQEVAARVGDPGVRAGHLPARLGPVGEAILTAGQPPLI